MMTKWQLQRRWRRQREIPSRNAGVSARWNEANAVHNQSHQYRREEKFSGASIAVWGAYQGGPDGGAYLYRTPPTGWADIVTKSEMMGWQKFVR